MSLKILLGLDETGLSDAEIMAKLREAEANNLDHVEFVIGGDVTKISLPT